MKIEDVISDFSRTIHESYDRLAAISAEESARPWAPGKWSRREVIGHLIDSAANNHQRFVRAQLEINLRFPGHDQNG